jgi:hypothetical protein
MAFKISKENTMEDMMKELAKFYDKPSSSNNVFVIRFLFSIKILECGSVVNHLNEFNMISSQLSYVGVKIDDEVRSLLILFSLLEGWNILVMSMNNFVSGSNTLNINDDIGVILSEQMRWKNIGKTLVNDLTTERRIRQRDRRKIPWNHGISKKGYSNIEGILSAHIVGIKVA